MVGHHREGLAQAVPIPRDVCCSGRTWVNTDEGFIKGKGDVTLFLRNLGNRRRGFFPLVFFCLLVCIHCIMSLSFILYLTSASPFIYYILGNICIPNVSPNSNSILKKINY